MDSSRRLMLVTSSDRRRGAEVLAEHLADGLQEAGWFIDSVCLFESGDKAVTSATPLASEIRGKFDPKVFRRLRRRIKQFTPDVVLAMGGPTLRYCALIGRAAPVVYLAIGEPRYWLRSRYSIAINRFLWRRAEAVIAVSHITADQLVQIEPRLRSRIDVVRPGVSMIRRRGPTIGHAPLRVLFVGSLSKEKDPLLALETVTGMAGAELRFVGSGDLKADLAREISASGLDDVVELAGAVDDIAPHYEWADVLILTSETEGLPGVVLEAAALGVPAVAVAVGGVGEAVEHEQTGFVVDRDVLSLREALVRFVDEPELVERMGEAAIVRAEAEFDLETTIRRFAGVLSGVAR